MTRATKISLLPLAILTLAGCSTNVNNGIAKETDFVALADVSSVAISSVTLKTKTASIAATANSGKQALIQEAYLPLPQGALPTATYSAHEADFYTDDDFKYATSALSIIGHSDSKNSSYYLVNGLNSLGYVYSDAAKLASHRAAAKKLLSDDYAYLVTLYNGIKALSSMSASDAGYDKVTIEYTNINATVGYNCVTVKNNGTSTTEIRYYLTLDKAGNGFVFTDVIIRQSVTNNASGGVAYSNAEYNLVHGDALEDQVFNLASMSISMAGLDLSTVPSTAIDQPAI